MANLTVVGLQWGDEGKGKLVDYLAGSFQAVARFNGGSNAGHTVVIGERKSTFHLIPSGALKRKQLLIGSGVAVDPTVLASELGELRLRGVRPDVTVDARCTLVSPLEKAMDARLEGLRGRVALGTTGRGIGPAYAMRAFRVSPRASDLGTFDFLPLKKFYGQFGIGAEGLGKWARDSARTLGGLLGDAGAAVDQVNEGGGKVLFEGSQGALLDILHGTYPYVTSSQAVATFVPASLGISASRVGKVLGVAKCYSTRVGGGPLPTEIRGRLSDAIREEGREYGATTGRPRRIGWLDLVALRYAVRVNGADELALTKVDILSRFKESKSCVAYRIDGSETTDFGSSISQLSKAKPVYEEAPSLYGASFKDGKSPPLRKLVEYLEANLKVKVRLVSWGEERNQTLGL